MTRRAPMTESEASRPFFDRFLARVTRFSVERRWLVLLLSVLIAGGSWSYASGLRIQGSFVELLPTGSGTAERFREAMNRKAGGQSTLIVMVRSENQVANQELIDRFDSDFKSLPTSWVEGIEKGPGESRDYFLENKWLFASRYDLSFLNCKIGQEVSRRSPGFLGLEDPCEEQVEFPKSESMVKGTPEANLGEPKPDEAKAEELSELGQLEKKINDNLAQFDRYPTGYFRNEEGTIYSLMIRAPSAGMGEFASDQLFQEVKKRVARLQPEYPNVEVGYAGDIPNAIAGRDALVSDMAVISVIAVLAILGSIALYFRSVFSLLQIGYCVVIGCGLSFALAMFAYGRLNTATSFLGSIIAGNGINYGIIYLARYRELRAESTERVEALVGAAQSSRKATWLAALAAGGAYAALLSTSFRGFSEFGLIGGGGMVFCWLATFSGLPAFIVLTEDFLPRNWGRAKSTLRLPFELLGRFTLRRRVVILGLGAVVTVAAAYPLPSYLSDPWEYNFSKLGSKKSRKKGAGLWSKDANKVFKSRGSPMLVMADSLEGVLPLRDELLARDQAITEGQYIERIETIYDRLGGNEKEVDEKLLLINELRSQIDQVKSKLSPEDLKIALDYRPPDGFKAKVPEELPTLVKAQYEEKDGTLGTPLFVYLAQGLSQSNGHNLLKISAIFESAHLQDGSIAPNASRSTVFAAMIRAMERDGPISTSLALLIVILVSVVVTRRLGASLVIVGSLLCGVILTVGGAAWLGVRLNFLNFVALPLTFGIGIDYAVNLYERINEKGNILEGISSVGGPVALCSFTTIVGYGALVFADNRALISFGQYAMAGELACILTALLLLPAALSFSRRFRPAAREKKG